MATVGWDCSRPTAGRLPSRGGCGEGYPADWDCLVAHRSHVATIQRDGAQVDDRPTGLLSRNGDPAPAFLRHRYDVFGAGVDKSEAPTWPAPHGRSNGPLTCLLQRLGPHDLNQGAASCRSRWVPTGQKREPAVCRKSCSSAIDTRPRASLRWGKRPKRAITSRCRRAKSAVRGSVNRSNSGNAAS